MFRKEFKLLFFKEFFDKAPFIDGDDAHHIVKSLRMRPGESLTVCDTKGADYYCTITDAKDDKVELKIDRTEKTQSEPSVFVSLFQCLPKGDKMDSLIKQSVELGVGDVTPVLSTNCVSRPDEKQLSKKIERWQKIAASAAEQSGRGRIPQVLTLPSYKAALERAAQCDKSLLFYENERATTLRMALAGKYRSVSLLTGPEGGLEEREVEQARAAGLQVCTLGKRILRCETAPLAVLSMILYQYEL